MNVEPVEPERRARLCSWCHTVNREGSHWPGLHDRCAQQAGAFLPIDRRRALSVPRHSAEWPPPSLLERWGSQCWFCHCSLTSETMTRDHLLPRSRGGDDRPANLRPACKSCNGAKGSRTEEEFLAYCRAVVEDGIRARLRTRAVYTRVYQARLVSVPGFRLS